LYAIAKALHPETVIDIGTRWGSCTLQFLTGAPDARVISVDIETHIHGGPNKVGKFIPEQYQYEQVVSDAVQWIGKTNERVELIFEDTAHSQETTYGIYKHAKRVLNEGGVIISHDAVHPKFKGAVVAGIKQAGIEPKVYLVEGDSCGLAIWQKRADKPKLRWESETAIMDNLHETKMQAENHTEKKQEKPKRKRRKKAPKKVVQEFGDLDALEKVKSHKNEWRGLDDELRPGHVEAPKKIVIEEL
jgi:cyclopropane fatty-acyl-phospholipid synthase-like methyltransferase